MKISDLQRFVALVDEDVHFPRAAEALGIPLPSLYSSMDKLEAEVGHPLFTNTKNGPILTPAGTLLLDEAKRQIAAAPAPADKPKVPGGRQGQGLEGQRTTPGGQGSAEAVQEAPGPLAAALRQAQGPMSSDRRLRDRSAYSSVTWPASTRHCRSVCTVASMRRSWVTSSRVPS